MNHAGVSHGAHLRSRAGPVFWATPLPPRQLAPAHRDATALRAPKSPRRNQGVPCYNDAMRAITLLLTGALVMANPAEVRRMVEARFNMRAMAQQPPEYNPDDIGPPAYLATPPPPPLRRPLGMISTKEQSRLNDQLMYGCITPEQYVRATRMDNPPPGVDRAVGMVPEARDTG